MLPGPAPRPRPRGTQLRVRGRGPEQARGARPTHARPRPRPPPPQPPGPLLGALGGLEAHGAGHGPAAGGLLHGALACAVRAQDREPALPDPAPRPRCHGHRHLHNHLLSPAPGGQLGLSRASCVGPQPAAGVTGAAAVESQSPGDPREALTSLNATFGSPAPQCKGLGPDGVDKRVPKASKNHRLL